MESAELWLFAYGSLIWNPGFDYLERQRATAPGWVRRFWQGSHDHRGLPEAPGRVVTLVPAAVESCEGIAFRVSSETRPGLLEALDHREKNGYQRHHLALRLADGRSPLALTWIAPEGNFAWAGPATLDCVAERIAASVGPSGRNDDYLFQLAAALRAERIDDQHVVTLEQRVRAIRGPVADPVADSASAAPAVPPGTGRA